MGTLLSVLQGDGETAEEIVLSETPITRILERLKAATGHDRAIELEIYWNLICLKTVRHKELDDGSRWRNVSLEGDDWRPWHEHGNLGYTSSVDAALKLVATVLPRFGISMAKGRLTPQEPMFGVEIYTTDLVPDGEPPRFGDVAEHHSLPLCILTALFSGMVEAETS